MVSLLNRGMEWRFKQIVEERGISQEKVAEMLDCSIGQANMLLNGGRGKSIHKWVAAIEAAFSIPAWQLFISPDKVWPKEAQHVWEAYRRLSGDSRRIVDQFLFGVGAEDALKKNKIN